jgi:uncharacterized SAM-binding protein YcdF (DUF218 family)
MRSAAPSRPRYQYWFWWLPALTAAAIAAFLAIISVHILRQAGLDEARSVDAIIVFGAAEYAGRPSPVFRARLDHGYDLFQRRLAPLVITTGGAGDERFTEGGVGRDYLISRGVPDQNLIAETQSDNTAESAERVAVILRANGIHSCLAVSDAYHIYRIKKLMGSEGVAVYGSPRPGSVPRSRWARFTAVLREALSYTLWRLHVT